jgi:hypothetical protein
MKFVYDEGEGGEMDVTREMIWQAMATLGAASKLRIPEVLIKPSPPSLHSPPSPPSPPSPHSPPIVEAFSSLFVLTLYPEIEPPAA